MIKYNFLYLAAANAPQITSENEIDKFIGWLFSQSSQDAPDKQENCLHANSQFFLKNFTNPDAQNSLNILWTEDKRGTLGSCLEGCPKGGMEKRCKFNRLVIPKDLQYNNEVEAFFGKIENEFAKLNKKGWDAFENPSAYEVLVTISFLCINFYRSKVAMEGIYQNKYFQGKVQVSYFKEVLKESLKSINGKTILFFRTFHTPLLLSKEHVLVAKKKIEGFGLTTNLTYSDFIYAPLSRYYGCIIYTDSFKNEKFLNVRNMKAGMIKLPEYKVDMDFVVSNLIKPNNRTVFSEGHYLSEQLAREMNLFSIRNTLFSEYYGYDIVGEKELEEMWLNRRKTNYAKILL